MGIRIRKFSAKTVELCIHSRAISSPDSPFSLNSEQQV